MSWYWRFPFRGPVADKVNESIWGTRKDVRQRERLRTAVPSVIDYGLEQTSGRQAAGLEGEKQLVGGELLQIPLANACSPMWRDTCLPTPSTQASRKTLFRSIFFTSSKAFSVYPAGNSSERTLITTPVGSESLELAIKGRGPVISRASGSVTAGSGPAKRLLPAVPCRAAGKTSTPQ